MQRRELLRIAPGAALGWMMPPALRAVRGKTGKVLYFTRSAGFEHSVVRRKGAAPSHSEKALLEMGRRAGFEVECTRDGRVFDGSLDAFDVIAFYTSGDLTRAAADGSPAMTAQGKQRLLEAIAAGAGFVGFHSATDTFHSRGPREQNQTEVDPYIAMLGGEFLAHGPQQEASLILASRFPGAGNLGMAEGIAFTDEWYTFKNFRPDLHVILAQETQMMQGACYRRPDFPATWARRHGQGRVFFTSLGHREDIWLDPFFQAIALGGIAWAMGRVDFDVQPNIGQVTPRASQLKHAV
ncbi:MAG: ThuA domain-containing protein [Acidobacteria bacterium]|nr:ThuA domain-containing protein [Acidobacteriota bacterium]